MTILTTMYIYNAQFLKQGMTSNVKLHVVLVTPHGQITTSIEQDNIEWIIVT